VFAVFAPVFQKQGLKANGLLVQVLLCLQVLRRLRRRPQLADDLPES
jgi:hypothetical protein